MAKQRPSIGSPTNNNMTDNQKMALGLGGVGALGGIATSIMANGKAKALNMAKQRPSIIKYLNMKEI